MVDTTRDYAAVNGYKKVCLLGTLPTAEEKTYIGTKIETELEFGKFLPVPYIDVMQVHIDALVDLIMQDK